METQKAIVLIAEVLDVLVRFIPDCGGDFKEGTLYCKGCEFYSQCKRGTEAQDLCSELQAIVADRDSNDIDSAYCRGFDDAYGGFENNPYSEETEPELYRLYECGNVDGAM